MTDDTIKPIQKILFGCPGTGKSYKIREIAEKQLNISFDSDTKILKNTVKTVFHPEYTYGDFMGKLLPLTQGTNVIYKFYPGHFLKSWGWLTEG
jgi:5-methylcytosine-specific restriction protein B